MLADKLYVCAPVTDDEGRIRVDDLELRDDIQRRVSEVWDKIDNDNLRSYADLDGYQSDFLRLFGFGVKNVDYSADVDQNVAIPGLV
jgi:enoyl-[acyl-carrier protein] reductase/trans-2-enoyl-CoA reductase (NAD+)